MKVAITGGTGFIGSHVVARALDAGHDVRMLVRSPAKVDRVRATHGIASDVPIELAIADLEDHDSLRAGIEGCDALIHVAALFALNPRQAADMERINPAAAQTIIAAATDQGLDPIVYVSTMGVYSPPPAAHITADLDLSVGCGPYTRSKIAAERHARRAQADGVPVVCVYPGGVFGPQDPNDTLSDSVAVVRDIALGRMPTIPSHAVLPFIDVRDVAAVCVGALDAGRGPRRYLIPGTPIELRDVVRIVMSLTGRRLPILPAPRPALRWTGRIADVIAERTGRDLPFSAETVDLMITGIEFPDTTFDQTPARDDFGVPAKPLRTTIADTLVWMAESGHLPPEKIGRLAR